MMTAALRLVLALVPLLLVAPPTHAKRKIVPVPLWSTFDGARWGDLVLGQTTRELFVREYSSTETTVAGVMEANTPNKTNTQAFVLFDGPGSAAKLAAVVLFYDGDRGSMGRPPRPALVAWEDRYGQGAIGGYPPDRPDAWRLRIAVDRGAAALIQRDDDRERIAALIFAQPERLKPLAAGLSATETEVRPLLSREDWEPLVARVAYIDVNVDLGRNVAADRRGLRRDIERDAEDLLQARTAFRLVTHDGGRLVVDLEGETRRQNGRQIRLRARAALDADSPYGLVTTRTVEYTRDLDAGSSERHIEREARRLCEQVVAFAAGSITSDLERRRSDALAAAQRWARLGLVEALGAEDEKQP
jgi:hypothetical protein